MQYVINAKELRAKTYVFFNYKIQILTIQSFEFNKKETHKLYSFLNTTAGTGSNFYIVSPRLEHSCRTVIIQLQTALCFLKQI